MEIPAMCLAMLFAPLAYAVVGLPLGPAFAAIAEGLGASGLGELSTGSAIMVFSVGGTFVSYPVSWFVGLPLAVYFRASGRLSLWAALLMSLGIAWLGLVPLCFFVLVSQELGSALLTTALGSAIAIPGSAAVAVSFWGLYCFFTGEQFRSPLPWRKAVQSTDGTP
jgi:hypothetical protein